MGRACADCGKSALKAANRSHSKAKTLRRQKPNLQKDEKGDMTCNTCRRTAVKKVK
ncbi:MAG: bL28 family ribosomal protein [Candidatus Magasanikbacteria bacterium]